MSVESENKKSSLKETEMAIKILNYNKALGNNERAVELLQNGENNIKIEHSKRSMDGGKNTRRSEYVSYLPYL